MRHTYMGLVTEDVREDMGRPGRAIYTVGEAYGEEVAAGLRAVTRDWRRRR
jgi:hypothetical protein